MQDRLQEAPILKTSSIHSAISIELRFVTDRHRAIVSTLLAQHHAAKKTKTEIYCLIHRVKIKT